MYAKKVTKRLTVPETWGGVIVPTPASSPRHCGIPNRYGTGRVLKYESVTVKQEKQHETRGWGIVPEPAGRVRRDYL